MPSDDTISKLQGATYAVAATLGHEVSGFSVTMNPFRMKKTYEHGRRYSEMVQTVPDLEFGWGTSCEICNRRFQLEKFKGQGWKVASYSELKQGSGMTDVAVLDESGQYAMFKYQIPKDLFCNRFKVLE